MKKILFLLLFICTYISSQTLSQVEEHAKYLGENFSKFEKDNSMIPIEKESNFGIETKVYKLKDFVVVLEELEDNDLIGEISFMPVNASLSSEIWYKNVKEARSIKDYVFVKAFLEDKGTSTFDGNLTYEDLIIKLRKINNPNDISTEIYFKKNNIYYSFLLFSNKLSIKLTSNNPMN